MALDRRDASVQSEWTRLRLWVAAQEGRTAEVEALVEEARKTSMRSSELDAATSKALSIAASNDHADVVTALLAAGAKPNRHGRHCALRACARAGSVKAAAVLLSAKASVNGEGLSALHDACHMGHADVVKLLLDARADKEARNDMAETPLYTAVRGGWPQCLELLLTAKADVHARVHGWGAVHAAASAPFEADRENRTGALKEAMCAALRLLLAAKADIDMPAQPNTDTRGQTPAFVAAANDCPFAIQTLANAKADLDRPTNHSHTPLHEACYLGHTATVKALVTAGVNLSMRDEGDVTPLYAASGHGHTECVEVLAHAKAPLDQYVSGFGAMHVAAKWNCVNVLQVLSAAKADINLPATEAESEDETPAHYAAWYNACSALRVLGALRADLNRVATCRTCPLFLAAVRRNTGAVRTLLNLCVDPDPTGCNGRTPLMVAASSGDAGIVRLLVCAKADATRRFVDADRASPLSQWSIADVARKQGHEQVAALVEAAARGELCTADLPEDGASDGEHYVDDTDDDDTDDDDTVDDDTVDDDTDDDDTVDDDTVDDDTVDDDTVDDDTVDDDMDDDDTVDDDTVDDDMDDDDTVDDDTDDDSIDEESDGNDGEDQVGVGYKDSEEGDGEEEDGQEEAGKEGEEEERDGESARKRARHDD
jgi:ankyrin repeat protein